MTSTLSGIIIAIIVGVLARVVLSGRQNISVLVTVVVGIVGAFLGAGHVETDLIAVEGDSSVEVRGGNLHYLESRVHQTPTSREARRS